MKYNLELDRAVKQIKAQNAKLVCVQLPDGLKPEAGQIAEALESETGAKVVTWLGVDLLIQFGHSEWKTAK